jgi:drug/metabolite transporter (DMT)-like permease
MFSKGYQMKTENSMLQTLIFTALMSFGIVMEFSSIQRFTLSFTWPSFLYACIYAILIIVCEITSLKAFGLGKVSIVTLFVLIGGVALPFIYGVVILGEELTVSKGFAVLLMFLSFVMSLYEKKSKSGSDELSKTRKKWLFIIACVLVFLSNGFISIVIKAHQSGSNIVSETNFLILTSLISLCISLVLIVFLARKSSIKQVARTVPIKGVWLALGYAICNGTGTLLSMISARTLPSSIQFPMISGGVVALTAFLSIFIYKEKFYLWNYAGIGLTIFSVILFGI